MSEPENEFAIFISDTDGLSTGLFSFFDTPPELEEALKFAFESCVVDDEMEVLANIEIFCSQLEEDQINNKQAAQIQKCLHHYFNINYVGPVADLATSNDVFPRRIRKDYRNLDDVDGTESDAIPEDELEDFWSFVYGYCWG